MTSASETKTTEGGRGSFILFEGLDRTGKTTQCERLVAQLTKQKVPVVAKKFPDRTTATGAIIDAYLKGKSELDDHALHLLFAANRWEASGEIRSLLEKGTTVVVDRYSYSGAAFSSTKGLDLEWCMAAEKGLPAPDLVLYMSMPSDKLDARKDFGAERYEKKEIQKAASAVFDDFCESLQGWTSLDATKSIEDLEADILQLVVPALDQNRFSSILVVGQEKLSPMIRVLQNLYNYEFLVSPLLLSRLDDLCV